MVVDVLPSRSAPPAFEQPFEAALDHLEAMARLASESKLTLHVVVARAPRVVDRARRLADEWGLVCAVNLRAHTIRAQFGPARRPEQP